ncbi:MAG: hypothetical protein Q6373_021480 [Candidatus Sigynarchaeota archaeon]
MDREAQRSLIEDPDRPRIQISGASQTENYNWSHFACDDTRVVPSRLNPDQVVTVVDEVDILVPIPPPLNVLLIMFGNKAVRRRIQQVLRLRYNIELDPIRFLLNAHEQQVRQLFPGFRVAQVDGVADRYVQGGKLSGVQLEDSQDYHRFKQLGGELTGIAATYREKYVLLYKDGIIRSPNNFSSTQEMIELVMEMLARMVGLGIMPA